MSLSTSPSTMKAVWFVDAQGELPLEAVYSRADLDVYRRGGAKVDVHPAALRS